MKNAIAEIDLDDQFYKSILKYVSRSVSPAEDTEELTQDVFIKLLDNIDRVDGEHLLPWTYRTAKNTVIDFHRRRSRRVKLETQIVKEQTDKQEQEEFEFFWSCLDPLLSSLPKEQRTTLEMVEVQGHSQKELAEALGVPYSTLKSQIQRLRQKLKGRLKECCQIIYDRRGTPIDCSTKCCD